MKCGLVTIGAVLDRNHTVAKSKEICVKVCTKKKKQQTKN